MSDRRDSRYTRQGRIFNRANRGTTPETFRPQNRPMVNRQIDNHPHSGQMRRPDCELQKPSEYLGVWGGYHANATPTTKRLNVVLTDADGNYIATIQAWEEIIDGQATVKVITNDIVTPEFFDEVIAPIMNDYYEYKNPVIQQMPNIDTVNLQNFKDNIVDKNVIAPSSTEKKDGFFKTLFEKDKEPEKTKESPKESPKEKKGIDDMLFGPDLREK